MLTIFTTPRPFERNFDIIQRNAIKSWLKLSPKCEIILFEDEKGTTSKIAKEFGIKCITDVERGESGTPLFNDVIVKASETASYSTIAYVNTDIILLNNFIKTIKKIESEIRNKDFLIVGQRRDLDVNKLLNFNETNWEREFRDQVFKDDKLHNPAAIDYFVFPRNLHLKLNIRPFIIGRPYYDGWFLYHVHSLGIPLIDATSGITAVHQNHYRKYGLGMNQAYSSEKAIELKRNFKLLNGFYHALALRDTNWIFTNQGLKKRRLFLWHYLRRYLILFLSTYPCFDSMKKVLLFPVWVVVIIIRELQRFFTKK